MSKEAGRDMLGKKAQYYVEYLGWRASKGLDGRQFTEPVVRELVRRRHSGPLPKLTIQVSKKEIKVTRDVAEDSKKKKIKTIKYPAIPARDVSFAVQALEPDMDIVSCIYLGFNPRTSCYVHIHVYRCDSPTTAATFVRHMLQIINIPEHKKRLNKIELELLGKHEIEVPYSVERESLPVDFPPPQGRYTMANGQVGPHIGSSAASTDSNESPPTGSDDVDADLYSLKEVMQFDAVADELKHRLKVTSAPILLPPADYDTVSRAKGNVIEANKRKSRNPIIVGKGGADKQAEGSTGSADLPSPVSDRGENIQFPSEEFYLYPPRSPRDENSSETYSPRAPVFHEGSSSPVVVRYGRQHSSSSDHSHHIIASGSRQSNGPCDSRDRLASDRLSGYSSSSNSYRDLNLLDGRRVDSQRDHRSRYEDEILLRPKDNFRRGPNLTNSMPADILRREVAAITVRDQPYRGSGNPEYSDRFSPAPSSPRAGDFGVRRVNSMYR